MLNMGYSLQVNKESTEMNTTEALELKLKEAKETIEALQRELEESKKPEKWKPEFESGVTKTVFRPKKEVDDKEWRKKITAYNNMLAYIAQEGEKGKYLVYQYGGMWYTCIDTCTFPVIDAIGMSQETAKRLADKLNSGEVSFDE